MSDVIRRRTGVFLVLPILAIWASAVSASIMRVDDSALAPLGGSQDGFNITRDVDNNLDWLDWRLTTNLTYDGANTLLLGPGGLLEGWRFATAQDFLALAVSAAIPATHIDAFVEGDAPAALMELALALGITRFTDVSAFAMFNETGSKGTASIRLGGITTARPLEDLRGRIIGAPRAILDTPNDPEIWLSQSWSIVMASTTIGAALVRQPPLGTVSSPVSLSLFVLGLLVLGASRRGSSSIGGASQALPHGIQRSAI